MLNKYIVLYCIVPTANPAHELYLAWDDIHIDTFRNKLLDKRSYGPWTWQHAFHLAE